MLTTILAPWMRGPRTSPTWMPSSTMTRPWCTILKTWSTCQVTTITLVLLDAILYPRRSNQACQILFSNCSWSHFHSSSSFIVGSLLIRRRPILFSLLHVLTGLHFHGSVLSFLELQSIYSNIYSYQLIAPAPMNSIFEIDILTFK